MRTSPAPGGPRRGRLRALLGLLAALGPAFPSAAQEPVDRPPPATLGGLAPRLPLIPEAINAPALSLVEGVGSPTAAVEIKVGQGRFLAFREDLVVPGQPAPFLAVGDPGVVDFFQVGPRQLRLLGKNLGTTDLSITTGSGRTYDFEVRVVADLETLRDQLRQLFPDASLRLSQVRDRLVVEGQARDAAQVSRILAVVKDYVAPALSGQVGDARNADQAGAQGVPQQPAVGPGGGGPGQARPYTRDDGAAGRDRRGGTPGDPSGGAAPSGGFSQGPTPGPSAGPVSAPAAGATVQVVNLIRVPTSQQVLLKVRVVELNRTGFRQIGGDLAGIPQVGELFGTRIGGNDLTQGVLNVGTQGTFFGRFAQGDFLIVLNALRRNNLLKILAEPNLITLNGHQANFLAGGEFPVPVLQGSGGVGGSNSISVQFREFGVRLAFLPIIQDGDTIRLTVDPEVSSIDFSVGTTLVPGGSPIPGLNTRKSHSTVELKPGDTLAIAGLMQLSLAGQTAKLPGLGDLPYIGAFFGNTTGERIEKELVVTVTPYIVEPMGPGQLPALPGEEVREPNDLEFYFLNRIEGRTGVDKRSTTAYDDPLHLIRHSLVEKKYLIGPSGYSK